MLGKKTIALSGLNTSRSQAKYPAMQEYGVSTDPAFPTLPGLGIERPFAQPIIYQDQTTVGGSKFRETDCLRSEIEGNQARRWGHGVNALRNRKM